MPSQVLVVMLHKDQDLKNTDEPWMQPDTAFIIVLLNFRKYINETGAGAFNDCCIL